MITVGGRRVISTDTIFIPLNESATVELSPEADDNHIYLTINFIETDDNEKNQPTYSISGVGHHGTLTLTNWTKPFGSNVTKPIFFASTDTGRHISCIFSASKVGEAYRIDIQFMIGDEKK